MDDNNATKGFDDLTEDAKIYLRARIDLMKLHAFEKSSRISSYVLTRIIVIGLIFFALWALAMAFVYWYESLYNVFTIPFLMVTGAFIFLILIMGLFGNKIITRQIIRAYADIFLDDDDPESPLTKNNVSENNDTFQ